MHVKFDSAAKSELIEAALYYDEQLAGLGDAFGRAVEFAISKVAAEPSRFPVVIDSIQRCRVTRFPYCIYFHVMSDVLYIVAVAHHSRHPDYWKGRLP